jgi:hypothetical protein
MAIALGQRCRIRRICENRSKISTANWRRFPPVALLAAGRPIWAFLLPSFLLAVSLLAGRLALVGSLPLPSILSLFATYNVAAKAAFRPDNSHHVGQLCHTTGHIPQVSDGAGW